VPCAQTASFAAIQQDVVPGSGRYRAAAPRALVALRAAGEPGRSEAGVRKREFTQSTDWWREPKPQRGTGRCQALQLARRSKT
jgi:hypothetical protein